MNNGRFIFSSFVDASFDCFPFMENISIEMSVSIAVRKLI